MKILIADDDPIARAVLDAELRTLGHEIILTQDGEEAWSVLCSGGPRLVVTDWLMPRLDGLELCRRVRGAGGDYVYFILLSEAGDTRENERRVIEAGVDDFLHKPINRHELWMRLRVAERILAFTRQVRELESIVPICGYCKKIRDDSNYWNRIEHYIEARTGAQLSHSICPDCMERIVLPQLEQAKAPRPPPSSG